MLYKYLPEARVDVIENLKIRFSPLISLNDPFECQPLIDVEEDVVEGGKEIMAQLEKFWDENARTLENISYFERMKKAVEEGLRSSLDPVKQGHMLVETLGHDFGILSLSRSDTSLLMWSHYADSHSGYLIGFDEQHNFFQQTDLSGDVIGTVPVVYTEKRSLVKYGSVNWYKKLLFEKPIEWAYEQEERLCRANINGESLGVDEHQMAIKLEIFPACAVGSIIIGYRAKEETREKILNSIRKNHISCPIYDAKLSNAEYKLEFHKISFA